MKNSNERENGMFTGKRIFFYCVKSNLIERIRRILLRLEAEIVEQPNIDHLHLVIVENDQIRANQVIEKKRKNDFPIKFQSKRFRLTSIINNLSKSENMSKSVMMNDSYNFLTSVKEKKIRIKTVNEIWQWLFKYYQILIENDDYDDQLNYNETLDKNNRLKVLELPALKILDPFGGSRPEILQNCVIEENLWYEYEVNNSKKSELKRLSTGTSRLRKKVSNNSSGYCECCKENYYGLYQHIKSTSHRKFNDMNSNFAEIDLVIAKGPTISEFLSSRQKLLEKRKLSRLSLHQLPCIIPKIYNKVSKEVGFARPSSDLMSVNDVIKADEEVEKCSSTSDSSSSSDSSDSSNSDTSKSSSTSNTGDSNMKGINCVSCTVLHNPCKARFSLESLSADENEQSQISQHVNEIVENLNIQLSDKIDSSCRDHSIDLVSDLTLPHLDGEAVFNNSNFNSRIRDKLTIPIRDNSPIISRRFDWCKKCNVNHVPIGILNFTCPFNSVQRSDEDVILNSSSEKKELNPFDSDDYEDELENEKCDKTNKLEISNNENNFKSNINQDESNNELVSENFLGIAKRTDTLKGNNDFIKNQVDLDCGEEIQNKIPNISGNILKTICHEKDKKNEEKQLVVKLIDLNNQMSSIKTNNKNKSNQLDEIFPGKNNKNEEKQLIVEIIDLNNQSKSLNINQELSIFNQLNNDVKDDNDEVNKGSLFGDRNGSPGSRFNSIENVENRSENYCKKAHSIKSLISTKLSHDSNPVKEGIETRRKLVAIENKGLAFNNRKNSLKRKAALSANCGIIKTNQFFKSNIENTLDIIQVCVDKNLYNKRLKISQMNFEKDFKSESKRKKKRN